MKEILIHEPRDPVGLAGACSHVAAMTWLRLATPVLMASIGMSLLSAQPAPLLDDKARLADLLLRVSRYIDRFQREATAFVVEELYVQIARPGPPPSDPQLHLLEWDDHAMLRPAPELTGSRRDSSGHLKALRRQTRSDVLFIQLKDRLWSSFRDVLEVDGVRVHDRPERLQRLFLEPSASAREQLAQITEDSARYNLGRFSRTINQPTFGLLAFRASEQGRMRFRLETRPSPIEGLAGIRFEERKRPFFVRSGRDSDVRLAGTVWLHPETGCIHRTDVRVRGRLALVEARMITDFGPVDRASVRLPVTMWERYTSPQELAAQYVEGRATYANVRRFTVETTEGR